MNLLAKRENELPAELERLFPGADELVRNFFGRFMEPGAGWLRGALFESRLDCEVREKDVVVRISCPGCKPGDFNLEIIGDFLNFKVQHCTAAGEKDKHKRFIFRERSCAECEESIRLPVPVKGAAAEANYRDGVVTVTLPRDLDAKKLPGTIRIECGK